MFAGPFKFPVYLRSVTAPGNHFTASSQKHCMIPRISPKRIVVVVQSLRAKGSNDILVDASAIIRSSLTLVSSAPSSQILPFRTTSGFVDSYYRKSLHDLATWFPNPQGIISPGKAIRVVGTVRVPGVHSPACFKTPAVPVCYYVA